MPPEHHGDRRRGYEHSDAFDDTQPSRFSGQLDVPPPRIQRAPRTPPPDPTPPDPTPPETTQPQLPPQAAAPPETSSATLPTRRVPPPGSVPDETNISRVPIDSDQAALDPPTRPGGLPGQVTPAERPAARQDRTAVPDRRRRAANRQEPPAAVHAERSPVPPRRKRARPAAEQPATSRPTDDGPVHASAITVADGLGKFDLGTVPASVTPPRSWRRAAWFAVASSMGVVVALLFAAATLVGPPKNARTIDALPNGYANNNYPYSMRQSPSGTDAGSSRQDATTRADEDDQTTGESRDDASSDAFGAAPRPGIGSSSPAGAGSGSGTGSPSGSDPPSGTPSRQPQRPPSPKPVVKVHNRGTPVANANRMADNTRNYYYAVTEDPQAAHQLTTGSTSAKEIEQRYSDVAYILVRQIEVYPDRPVTVNTVEVTYAGGDTVTEQRELVYSPGPDPKVESDN